MTSVSRSPPQKSAESNDATPLPAYVNGGTATSFARFVANMSLDEFNYKAVPESMAMTAFVGPEASLNLLMFYADSWSHVQPNELTMAFSIKSIRDHVDMLRKISTSPETIQELFPAHLVQSASNFFGFEDSSMLNRGLMNHIAATIVQTTWRTYVAKKIVRLAKEHRKKRHQEACDHDLFLQRVVTSQTAARRYLARKHVSKLRSVFKLAGHIAAHHHHHHPSDNHHPAVVNAAASTTAADHMVIGHLSAEDLPPNSVFDIHGNRIRGEYVEGALAMHCAASVIQRQVRRRVLDRFHKARDTIRRQSQVVAVARRVSAAESVMALVKLHDKRQQGSPTLERIQSIFSMNRGGGGAGGSTSSSPKMMPPDRVISTMAANSKGSALAAVFWDAAGLLLNPRRAAFSTPTTANLWGVRILHDVAMLRRRSDPSWLTQLPLTIWVQGPLESTEKRSRPPNVYREQTAGESCGLPNVPPRTPSAGVESQRVSVGDTLSAMHTPPNPQQRIAAHMPLNAATSPRALLISQTISPRLRRPQGSATARRLSPLGRVPKPPTSTTVNGSNGSAVRPPHPPASCR